MRITITIITCLLLTIGGIAKFSYDKFSAMNKEVQGLNKVLKNLNIENVKLKKQNSSLNKKIKNIHKKFKNSRVKITSRKKSLIQNKLAKAPLKMIPFAGASIVVGAVAYDVKEQCDDIDEIINLEKDMFGISDISNDQLCGYDYKEQKILLNKKLDSMKNLYINNQKEFENYWVKQIHKAEESMPNININLDEIYKDTVRYWSN